MKTPAIFKISTVVTAGAATIDTDAGPIYPDTPEAALYVETKTVVDALGALVNGIKGMDLTKPQALAATVKLLEELPAQHVALARDLQGFRDSLETGRDFAADMVRLEQDQLSRLRFGMKCAAGSAPGPARPGTVTPEHAATSRHPSRLHREDPKNYPGSY